MVFNNQEEVEEAFKGSLNKDCIIVVKGQDLLQMVCLNYINTAH